VHWHRLHRRLAGDRISLIVSSCVVLVRVLVLVLVPRNRIFVIVLDPFRRGLPNTLQDHRWSSARSNAASRLYTSR
jgi:hypothetical protein